MIKQDWIDEMKNDPEFMAGIHLGVHESHLGHVFSWWLVKRSFQGWFGLRLYCRLVIRMKKIWWVIKTPYEKIVHLNCPNCISYRGWLREPHLGERFKF